VTTPDARTVNWEVSAKSDAVLTSSSDPNTAGGAAAEWCLSGTYAGLKTKISVVSSGGGGVTTPAPTPAPTQSCPAGFTLLPSSYTSSPRDSTFCAGKGTSSCKVCQSLGSWVNGKRQVTLTLACQPSSIANAYRSWYSPYNTQVDRQWLTNSAGATTAGTTWTLTVLGGDQTAGDKFKLTNEWCLDVAGFTGYVAANAVVPLP